jgi:hypothetical protein
MAPSPCPVLIYSSCPWISLKMAPVTFLYPLAFLLYDSSNIEPDFINTLYIAEKENHVMAALSNDWLHCVG